jgi:hypothetical protein
VARLAAQKKGGSMFGIDDPQVWLAYLLCILAAAFAVVYGILNWNKGDGPVHPEDAKWVKAERSIDQ